MKTIVASCLSWRYSGAGARGFLHPTSTSYNSIDKQKIYSVTFCLYMHVVIQVIHSVYKEF